MIEKVTVLICSLLSFNFLWSQNQPYKYTLQVIYKMTWQPDSTNMGDMQNEYMTLLIGQSQSVFCASQFLIMDSAITAELQLGNKLGPSFAFFNTHGTHNSLVVFKTQSETITYDNIYRFTSNDQSWYKEQNPLLEWTIASDTIHIAGIVCQKAEGFFGNRKWIAWFAPSIPVSDGPYKFSGLPGLILRIYDSQRYWNFDIASLRHVDRNLKLNFLNRPLVAVKNKEQFLAKRKYARDNRFELMTMRGAKFPANGGFEKKFKEEAKADNNWIELYKGN